MRRHLVGLVVPLAACLLSAAPAFAGEAQWVEVKSPHFSVVTDGGEKRGRDVAIRLEQMRAVFGTLFSQTNVNLPVPLQIVAFPQHQGVTPVCATVEREADGSVWSVRGNRPQLHPAGPVSGEPMGGRLSRIRTPVDGWESLQPNGSVVRRRVCHYIYHNKLTPKLINYFELADNKEVPVESAIQQAFGMTAARFDITMREYVMGGRSMYYRMPTPAGIVTTNYVTSLLSAADSSAVLADVHLHSPHYQQKAMEEYQAVLKTDAKNQLALRGLGYAYLLRQNFEEAGSTSSRRPRGTPRIPASTTMRHCLCPASVPWGIRHTAQS